MAAAYAYLSCIGRHAEEEDSSTCERNPGRVHVADMIILIIAMIVLAVCLFALVFWSY